MKELDDSNIDNFTETKQTIPIGKNKRSFYLQNYKGKLYARKTKRHCFFRYFLFAFVTRHELLMNIKQEGGGWSFWRRAVGSKTLQLAR